MASDEAAKEKGYLSTLPSDVRERYRQKTAVIGVDPYRVENQEFGRDRMLWPEVTSIDIEQYLVVG